MIFVDTGGWVAYVSSDDQYHLSATQWIRANRQPLITSDYIVDEALTLLKARGEPLRAQQLGTLLLGGSSSSSSSSGSSGSSFEVYYLTRDDILAAWQIFSLYTDKEWSFTDCTSKVVIEKLGLTHAFAYDQHFRQFGTITVEPIV